MNDTRNDLPPTTRSFAIALLNDHLATAVDLHLQAKQAHWNIKGPHFVGLHALFDTIAAQAQGYADEIAERAVALGGVAHGTLQAAHTQSALREYPLTMVDWRAHVRAVLDALATFARGTRKAIDDAADLQDAGTADLFTGVSRGIDKLLWMVEAHVQDVSTDSDATAFRSAPALVDSSAG